VFSKAAATIRMRDEQPRKFVLNDFVQAMDVVKFAGSSGERQIHDMVKEMRK
jgi:hypothetical protein